MPHTPVVQPRIVVIGLGVVGAAVADELVARGMRRVTVLEQGPLFVTGGSSSHAPGFVFQTSPDRVISQLAQRTMAKFDGIEVEGAWVSSRVGGLEIATSQERLRELSRRQGLASSWGVDSELVGPHRCAELFPLLDPAAVLGGLHTPQDGVVKSVRAVRFQAERAREGGAAIIGTTRVVAINTTGGRVSGVQVVPVPAAPDAQPQTIEADVVISCAGLWGPGLARDLLGFELPMMPMEHGFAWSTPLASLAGVDDLTEVVRPMLRHQDAALYLRESGSALAMGAYEHRPIPVEPEQIAGADAFAATGVHPAMHPFTAQDFAFTWQEARRILPELRSAEIDTARAFNGIFSFTPDGGPMVGPVSGVDGLWLAQAVWVTQSAGIGQVIADWVVSGDPGVDTHGLDYRRFDPAIVTHEWTVARSSEAYDEVYDIRHPRAETEQLRGLRTPPFHLRQRELGAVFGEAAGWERPLWFASNARLPGAVSTTRDEWSARHWSPIAAAEATAARSAAGLFDMTGLMRLEVSGPGSTGFLDALTSTTVDVRVGRVVYALLLDEIGGVLSDVTVARLEPERYHVGVNGHLDVAWFRQHLSATSQIRLEVVSTRGCGLGLWGPRARDILGSLTQEDVSHEGFGFYTARELSVDGLPVLAMRLSYVGELGWELYTDAEHGLALWDALWSAGAGHGLVAAGRRAFESMRLEKGFRLWGTDMNREHSPEEAGVAFAVRPAERTFIGAEAVAGRPVTRRLTCLTLADPDRVVMGHEPVYPAGSPLSPVGYVTSADQGYTSGLSIAYAWLPPGHAEVGTELEIEYFGERLPATVAAEPLVDPSMARMRC